MDNKTARKKIKELRKLLEDYPEATLCIDSEPPTEPRYTGEAVFTDPDGFHGRSYSAYLADIEEKSEVEPDDSKCQCEEVKTYGMVCVTCGKPYVMKTRFTVNGSAGEWCGND